MIHNIGDGFLSTFIEISCILIIRSKLVKKTRENLIKEIMIIFVISVVTFITDYFLHNFEFIADGLIIVICISLIYKEKFNQCLIQVIISFIFVSIVQLLSMLPFIFIEDFQNLLFVKYSSLTISLVISILIYFKVNINKIYLYLVKAKSKMFYFVTINSFIAIFSVWFYWNNNFNDRLYGLIYFILIILFILIANILILFYIERFNKQKEIVASYNKYNPFIEDLIKEIRKKQHEYENRIQAFSTLPEICLTYDDLINNMQLYTTVWSNDLQSVNADVLKLKYKIVASLIYSKMKSAEEKGIDITCKIDNVNVEYPMEEWELMDVIGILVDNAIEAVESYEITKEIEILFYETNCVKHIVVKNSFDYLEIDEINNFFTKSYSTKGIKRGFGLYNLNKILNKNKDIEILVYNEDNNNNNYIVFDLLFKN